MSKLKDIIYISNEDYETLVNTGTVVIAGETVTYDEDNIYITPEKLVSSSNAGLMTGQDKTNLDYLMSNQDKAGNTLSNNKLYPIGVESLTGTTATTYHADASKIYIQSNALYSEGEKVVIPSYLTTQLGNLTSQMGKQIIQLSDNGTVTAGTWLAKSDQITAYEDGQIFLYKITVAGGSETTTLNIAKKDGNNYTALGAKTIYRYGSEKLTTQYTVGQYLLLSYNSTNNCFTLLNDRDIDTNTDTHVRQYQYGSNAEGTVNKYPILTRYNLTNKNGTYDDAYVKYHTDVTIDTSSGTLAATALEAPTIQVITNTANNTKSNVEIQANKATAIDSNNNTSTTNYPTTGAVTTYVGSAISTAIAALPKSMVFKGTVGESADSPTITWANLPAAATANTGWTYIVVTAHSTAPICQAGDMIVSDGTAWKVVESGNDLYSQDNATTTVSYTKANGNNGDLLAVQFDSNHKLGVLVNVPHLTASATYGSKTQVPKITTNAAGYISAIENVAINNATLTITQNNTFVGTFTANQESAATIDIKTPTIVRLI